MAFSLKEIFNSFSGSKSTSVLGIDIGSSSIKVVQLKKKNGRAILETYGELSLGPYANTDIGRSTILGTEKLSEALKDLLRESNTTTKDCALSIPVSSSLIKFIKLPVKNEKQVAEMIPIEARRYIPVPISEVSLDYWVIPKNEMIVSEFKGDKKIESEIGTEVLLVAIHNDAVNKNRDIARLSQINSSFSDIEVFSSVRSIMDPSLSPQMVIDIGARSTKVYVVERGLLRASHTINRGSQDITLAISKSMNISFVEAERVKRENGLNSPKDPALSNVSSLTIDYIFSETGRFIFGYEKTSGKKISKMFMTGGGSLLKGLKEKAESSFNTPVFLADPFSKVEYPAFLENVLKEAGPVFAVAVGLVIRKLQEM